MRLISRNKSLITLFCAALLCSGVAGTSPATASGRQVSAVDVTNLGSLSIERGRESPETISVVFKAKSRRTKKIKGPFYFVLGNLKGAELVNKDGVTVNDPAGSPYVSNPKKSATRGTKVKFLLDFGTEDGVNSAVFSPRVFAGPGVP